MREGYSFLSFKCMETSTMLRFYLFCVSSHIQICKMTLLWRQMQQMIHQRNVFHCETHLQEKHIKMERATMIETQKKKFLWLPCPKCGARTKIKIYEDTVLLNFPLYCTKCKEETKLGVIKFKIVVSDEPDA